MLILNNQFGRQWVSSHRFTRPSLRASINAITAIIQICRNIELSCFSHLSNWKSPTVTSLKFETKPAERGTSQRSHTPSFTENENWSFVHQTNETLLFHHSYHSHGKYSALVEQESSIALFHEHCASPGGLSHLGILYKHTFCMTNLHRACKVNQMLDTMSSRDNRGSK